MEPITRDSSSAIEYVIALADLNLREATIASIATGHALNCDGDIISIGIHAIGIQP